MGILTQAAGLIASLSLLIMAHELGHFLFARIFKTRVEKFYLFFNPWFTIFKFRKGETEYGMGWLPLGGYVKIAGMIDESMDTAQLNEPPKPYEFRSKPAWQRLLIMTGGVVVNFLSALLIYILLMFFMGKEYIPASNLKYGVIWDSLALQQGLQNGDKVVKIGDVVIEDYTEISRVMVNDNPRTITVIRDSAELIVTLPENFMAQVIDQRALPLAFPAVPFIIDSVIAGMPAQEAGLLKDDVIVSVNGVETPWYTDVIKAIQAAKGQNIKVVANRAKCSDTLFVSVTNEGRIGIVARPAEKILSTKIIHYGFLASIPAGINHGLITLRDYVRQLKWVFTREGAKNVGGFGAIGSMFPKVWDWGMFWERTAFLSIILAFMNILPIPALDGGHVLFVLFEMVTGRKPNDKFLEYAQIAGMILLFSLLLFANGNDILRLFTR